MRALSEAEAAPLIACVVAAGEVQDRAAEAARQAGLADKLAKEAAFYDLLPSELIEARRIASRHGYTVFDAAAIVRRSRR